MTSLAGAQADREISAHPRPLDGARRLRATPSQSSRISAEPPSLPGGGSGTREPGVAHALWVYDRWVPKTIQIRNVPDHVHRTLQTRAAAAGESLSSYLLREAVRAAERPPVADVLARAAGRHEGTPTRSIVKAVRTGRDR